MLAYLVLATFINIFVTITMLLLLLLILLRQYFFLCDNIVLLALAYQKFRTKYKYVVVFEELCGTLWHIFMCINFFL